MDINKLTIKKFVMLVLLTCLPLSIMALSTDKGQPIHIEADSLMVDEPAGMSTYQGHVRYVQGSISIIADKLIVYAEKGELQKFEVFGEPAKYHQKLDSDAEEVHAEAMTIEYNADTGQVILQGNALLMRGENEFTGNKIIYDSIQGVVSARKAETGEQRVKVIIQPKQPAEDSRATAPVETQ